MAIRHHLTAAYYNICLTRTLRQITIEEMDLMLSPIMDVMTEEERTYAATQVYEMEIGMTEWAARDAAAAQAAEAAKIEAN